MATTIINHHMAPFGRVAAVGNITAYNAKETPTGESFFLSFLPSFFVFLSFLLSFLLACSLACFLYLSLSIFLFTYLILPLLFSLLPQFFLSFPLINSSFHSFHRAHYDVIVMFLYLSFPGPFIFQSVLFNRLTMRGMVHTFMSPEERHKPQPQLIQWLKEVRQDNISQTTFSRAFSWMKILVFWLKFQWNLFPKAQLMISQYWFR